MYIPPGLTFLRLLEFPLSLVGFDRSTSQPAEVKKDLSHFGNLSPYHDAPADPYVSVDLPQDCTVDQVILLHRHGSRGPTDEATYIQKLVSTLEAASEEIKEAELPQELEFLKDGYKYELVPEELTVIGRQQLFKHGAEFSLRYPTFWTNYVISTTVQRVIDSAHFFSQGFFGRGVDRVQFFTTEDCHECHDPVSWLDSWTQCPNMPWTQAHELSQEWADRYIPPIVDRLNILVPGVQFDEEDIRGALYACPYDLAARGESPWCNVFTSHELRGLEYELDLVMDTITGHDPRKDPGPLLGAFYVKKLVERLTNETGTSKSLHLDFAHDLTILLALSTMRLNKDELPLTPDYPPRDRKFRTSYQAPFAARMIWEKFTCETSFKGPQVRLLLNGETFPLTNCEESNKDREYGTCSLAAFKEANEWSMNAKYNSHLWNATCGHHE